MRNRKTLCADINGKVNLLGTLYQAEKTQLEVLRTQHASDKARLDEVSAEYAANSDRIIREESQRDVIKRRMGEISDRLAELAAVIEEKIRLRAECVEKREVVRAEHSALTVSATASERDAGAAKRALSFGLDTAAALSDQLTRAEEAIYNLNERKINAANDIERGKSECGELSSDIELLTSERKRLESEASELDVKLNSLRDEIREETRRREVFFREFTQANASYSQLLTENDRATAKIWEDYELTYTTASSVAIAGGYPPVTQENRAVVAAEQNDCRNRLRAIGQVNVGAIDEYSDVRQRYEYSKSQQDDLTASRRSLSEVIVKLEREMRLKFMRAFEEINYHFKRVFAELFGGGAAEITLTDREDVLNSGIEINVAPPGKIIKSMLALSGGEQAYVAIALIFAILCVNPTPFCVFDEIEAALDEVNVARFAEYMKRYSERIQFVVITHRRGTMETADSIYGVTMPERGISRVLALNLDEIEAKIGIK